MKKLIALLLAAMMLLSGEERALSEQIAQRAQQFCKIRKNGQNKRS